MEDGYQTHACPGEGMVQEQEGEQAALHRAPSQDSQIFASFLRAESYWRHASSVPEVPEENTNFKKVSWTRACPLIPVCMGIPKEIEFFLGSSPRLGIQPLPVRGFLVKICDCCCEKVVRGEGQPHRRGWLPQGLSRGCELNLPIT